MADKAILLQHQIKNNAESIREYMTDLEKWENEINSLDASLANKKPSQKAPAPPRNSIKEEEKKICTQTNPLYKRDKTSMQDYYKAWDGFDVDSELHKLEGENPPQAPTSLTAQPSLAPPHSKVVIKGGRSESNEVDRLKDQGNLAFSGSDFDKAKDYYTQCLDISNDPQVKVILFSNRAECNLRLRLYKEALADAELALELNSSHAKSILRLAKSKFSMNMYSAAILTLQEGLKLEPANSTFQTLLKQVQNKKKKLTSEIFESMTKPKASKFELEVLQVQEINGQTQEEPQEETKKNPKDLSKKAVESIVDVGHLPFPKSLVEMERNWVMLEENIPKLEAYIHKLLNENVEALFAKSSIESDLLMRFVSTFVEKILDPLVAQRFMRVLGCVKNLKMVLKFLTAGEKKTISELFDRIGREGLDNFNL